MTAIDLPQTKGTSVLITLVPHMKHSETGRLGAYEIFPGNFVGVSSAFGAGGLGARIGRRLELTATPHWHIDYLLDVAEPVEVWYTTANRKLERHRAELSEKTPRFCVPVPRLGPPNYHRSRSSFIFYCRRRLPFNWFQRLLMDEFEGLRTERYAIIRCRAGETPRPLVHEEFRP